MEGWLTGEECLLIFKRIEAGFPGLTSDNSQPLATLDPRHPAPFCGLPVTYTHADTHIHKTTKHTFK